MDMPLFFEYLIHMVLLYPPNINDNKIWLENLVRNLRLLSRSRSQILADRRKDIAKTMGVVATVGIGVLYVLLNRKRIFRIRSDPLHGQRIHIVSNPEECQKVVGTLRNHCQEFSVLGFDCEWVNHGNRRGGRHKVALLQLSTHQGLCVLIQLHKFWHMPQGLMDLLSDPYIIKVGINPLEDAKLLNIDYDLEVNSTLDLRFLAEKCGKTGGLARLAEGTLGVQMDKNWRISASNWEAYELTDQQIKYAANDAHVAIELFRTYAELIVRRSYWTSRRKWLTNVIGEFEDYFDQRFL